MQHWANNMGSAMKDLNPAVKESLTAQDHIRDATKMVKCICGDIYPADSFGAGFIAATGRCQNCCAAEQAEQEPVAWALTSENGEVLDCISHTYKVTQPCTVDYDEPLYAAPVRTKDLTDDEIVYLWNMATSDFDFARAVIAADREKNRG